MAARRKPMSSIAAMPGIWKNCALAAIATLAFAGCGGDDGTIPQGAGDDMLNQLDGLESSIAANQCEDAAEYASNFTDAVEGLPGEVEREVRDALEQVAAQMNRLVPSQCAIGDSGAAGVEPTETEEPATDAPETTVDPELTTPLPDDEATVEPEEPVEETAPPSDSGQGGGPSGNPGSSGQGTPSGQAGEVPSSSGGISQERRRP
jgi:hypothetical protein